MTRVGVAWVACIITAMGTGACGSPASPGADAGPDPQGDGGGTEADAEPPGAGLVLVLRGDPILAAEVGGDFDAVIDGVRFELESLRAIGDAAPGDERTTRDEITLDWHGAEEEEEGEVEEEHEADNEPVRVAFPEAPPGLYSLVLAQVRRYRVRGSVVVDDMTRSFEIDDSPASAIAISVELDGVMLEAGTVQEVLIEASAVAAVIEARWDEITPDGDGELHLDDESDQIESIRDKIADAFDAPDAALTE